MASTEFEGIFVTDDERRPVMSPPPRVVASKAFVRRLQDESPVPVPTDKRDEFADWIANLMERYGAFFAEPVFTMNGEGPNCSFCGAFWPLCGHHHMTGRDLGEVDDG